MVACLDSRGINGQPDSSLQPLAAEPALYSDIGWHSSCISNFRLALDRLKANVESSFCTQICT